MLKRFSLFFLLQISISALLWAQNITVEGIVVDAETGEPLPYASVFVSQENGTMTNDDGIFQVKLNQVQDIRISYVGYETLYVSAGGGKQTFRLKPLAGNMKEVTVVASTNVLMQVAKRLNKDYRKKGKRKANYFYRLTNNYEGKTEMTEAFLRGNSAVNLRDISFYSGRRVRQTRYSRTESNIAYSNLQHLVDLGPMTVDIPFWTKVLFPIYIKDKMSWRAYRIKGSSGKYSTRKYAVSDFAYDLKVKQTTTSNGQRIYAIDAKLKKELDYPALEGTLYVDAETFRLISFEGSLANLVLDVGVDFHKKTSLAKPNVKIIYTHDNGFTEVESVVSDMTTGSLKTRSVLYNMRAYALPFSDLHQMKNDMLSAIDHAGYDSTLWSNEVVKRTVEEQHLAWFANLTPEEQEEWILANVDTAFSQSGAFRPLVSRLDRFGRAIPQEKVYIHMDNTSYMLGDTLWFKAYTRQTNTDAPSNVSGVLYVELWNHEGYMLKRKQIEMKEGSGHGFFSLDKDELYAGFYELRAYTRWQLNWGRFEHKHSRVAGKWFPNDEFEERFYRDYDKLYSRTFPVYDSPVTPGNFDHTMTLRAPRRTFKEDKDKRRLVLTLFPEGGAPVVGQPCRVAFEAAWNDGQWVEGWLHIDNDSVPATNRGRGYFVYTPDGKKPKIRFITKDGQKVSAKLPDAERDGVSLQVVRNGKDWCILTGVSGKLHPSDLALTIMHQGVVKRVWHNVGRPLVVHQDSLDAGVHQVTVFDAQGRVYADRLFFTYGQADAAPTVQIDGVRSQYTPYEHIKLTLKAKAKNADVSLAVRDANRTDKPFDNGNILTEMLLASEIKGFVPDPGWYFQEDTDERRHALDLLMMTQGWRRFDWRSMAVKGAWELTQPDEKAPILMGKIYSNETFDYSYYPSEGSRNGEYMYGIKSTIDKEVTVHAELLPFVPTGKDKEVELEGIYVQEKMTKNQMFRIQLPRIYEPSLLYLDASDTTKWTRKKRYQWVQQLDDYEDRPAGLLRRRRFIITPPEFYVTVDFPYPRFTKPYSFHQTHLMSVANNDPEGRQFLSDGTTLMQEVTVKSKRNIMRRFSDREYIFKIDAYEAYNMAHDAGIMFERTQVSDYGLEWPYVGVLRHIDPGTTGGMIRDEHSWDDRMSRRYSWSTEKRISEGLTVDPDSAQTRDQLRTHHSSYTNGLSSWSGMQYRASSRADKITFYSDYSPRLEGSRRYWGSDLPETTTGQINFPNQERRVIYRNRRFMLPGFAKCGEFYNPDYSQRKVQWENGDYRRTLYWNPNVKFNDDGQAEVSFYNNYRTTQISVDAAGQAQDGTLLWNNTTEQ